MSDEIFFLACWLSGKSRHANRVIGPRGLLASTHDAVARRVRDEVDVLLFLRRLFPNLDLAAATNDADAHGREQVVGSVRVEVDATVEDGGTVFADSALDESASTGVGVNEIGHVVDNAADKDKSASLGLLLELVKLNDGQLLNGDTPVEARSPAVELLLLLLDETLLNGVLRKALQVLGHANLTHDPDEDLGGVVLVPLESVAVVRGELVVKVVVTFTEGGKRSQGVVTRGAAVVKGLLANPVSKRVDAESRLVDNNETDDTRVDKAAHVVAPAETSHERGEEEAKDAQKVEVVLVLETDNGVLVQIRNVGSSLELGVLLEDHPAHVRKEETALSIVGVLVGVDKSVVGSVAVGPPLDGTLTGTATDTGQNDSEGESTSVGSVSPHAVVPGGDTETREVVVGKRPNGGLCVKRSKGREENANEGNNNDNGRVDPVNVIVPVGERERLVRDVDLGLFRAVGVGGGAVGAREKAGLDLFRLVVCVCAGREGEHLVDVDRFELLVGHDGCITSELQNEKEKK